MKVLGLDFETQDDKPETTNITEIGAVLAEFGPAPEPTILKSYSAICYEPQYPPQTEFIVGLTGITDEMLKTNGISRVEAFKTLIPLVDGADLIVAHNVRFDRGVYNAQCARMQPAITPHKWLCTMTEVPYPDYYRCKKLSHLALDHGIEVDVKKLHRATYDVELSLKLLAKYNLNAVLLYASQPWEYLNVVCVPPWQDNGVSTTKAKALGYSWQQAPGDDRVFDKSWVKRVKGSQIEVEREKAAKMSLRFQKIG